jgi:hypothetical protein
MNSFVKLYKLLKYSNKLNTVKYLNGVKNNNPGPMYKLAKKTYIHNQLGGSHIDLSDCKEIYISNFHGKMMGKSFQIPNNTWVVVPYGTGLVNMLENEEKEFFLQNREKILDEFNKNNGSSIKLFNKNLLILKPGDSYCDIQIQIKFDNLVDEGLYEVEHAQKLMTDPFYRKINFGDVFPNPLKENYLIGFNISPKYKDILRLYLSKKDFNFNTNTLKNDPYSFKKNIKNKINKDYDRMYKITRFSENDNLVINNISRIMYPLLVINTIDIVNKIYAELIQQIANFELPINDDLSTHDNYTKTIVDFKELWGIDDISQTLMDNNDKYNKLISRIETISTVMKRNIEDIKRTNSHSKHADNFNKFKKINDNLVKEIRENINYEVIFDTMFQKYFDHGSSEKISLIENIKTTIENKQFLILTIDQDNYPNIIPIFNLMYSLDTNVKSLVMGIYYWTSFHLIFCKVLDVMSSISLELLKNSLMSDEPMHLSDIVKLVNKTSREKKIIFSRSCQGFDSEVSIENAARCLKYTTDSDLDLTNGFNQGDINKLILTIDYIKKNNLDNIFDEEIGDQDEGLYYDLICALNNTIRKTDILIKIFVIYLKKNFTEIYNYFKHNMELEAEQEMKVEYIKYQFKIVLLMINLFIKSVYDKTEPVHKKNILDIMNS